MPYALHFPLNTTLPASKHLKCFPNLISVEGHTDWITVTVLMCELRVSVTGCTGHIDLNVNQTTHSYKEPNVEVMVTLCGPFRTTSTQKPFHIGFNTGYFPSIGLSTTNDQFYTHPPSHPWVCFACHQEG